MLLSTVTEQASQKQWMISLSVLILGMMSSITAPNRLAQKAVMGKNESISHYQQLSALMQVIQSNLPRTLPSKTPIMPKQTQKRENCPKLNQVID